MLQVLQARPACSARPASGRSKKTKIHSSLSDEEEQSMVEWLQDNLVFYNKKMKNYTDMAKNSSRPLHACDTMNKFVLRSLYARPDCNTSLLRSRYAVFWPRSHYDFFWHVQNFTTRSTLTVTALRSIAFALRPQKIELRSYCVLHVFNTLCERGGNVVRSCSGVTGALYELHWLPIAERIKFKLCLLVHHVINGRAPSYLTELITSVANVPGRASLRSAGRHDLVVPRSRLVSSERAFSVAAPRAWNSLPVDIRLITDTKLFKKKLKTHLFNFVSDIIPQWLSSDKLCSNVKLNYI